MTDHIRMFPDSKSHCSKYHINILLYRFPKYTDFSFSTAHRKRFLAKVKPLYRKMFEEGFDWPFKKLLMILMKSMTSAR
jgi:hypothetical protein